MHPGLKPATFLSWTPLFRQSPCRCRAPWCWVVYTCNTKISCDSRHWIVEVLLSL